MNLPVQNESLRPLLNIILVEDDDGDAKAIRRALKKVRIANPVIRVTDGVEALGLLRGETDRPPERYVLLVDLNMPRMNGLELVGELRAGPDPETRCRLHADHVERRTGSNGCV